jgi:hypothetical protein
MKNNRPKSKHQPKTLAEAQAIIEEQHAMLRHAENVLSFYADPTLWKDTYAGSTADAASRKLREYINSQRQPKQVELKINELVKFWWEQWLATAMLPAQQLQGYRKLYACK